MLEACQILKNYCSSAMFCLLIPYIKHTYVHLQGMLDSERWLCAAVCNWGDIASLEPSIIIVLALKCIHSEYVRMGAEERAADAPTHHFTDHFTKLGFISNYLTFYIVVLQCDGVRVFVRRGISFKITISLIQNDNLLFRIVRCPWINKLKNRTKCYFP